MDSVLFCIPLKPNNLKAFKQFIADTERDKKIKWLDMLSRYNLASVKVWYKQFGDCQYVFVYHDTLPGYEEKLATFDNSTHPFDKWFNQQIMAVYDVANVAGMESPSKLTELRVK